MDGIKWEDDQNRRVFYGNVEMKVHYREDAGDQD